VAHILRVFLIKLIAPAQRPIIQSGVLLSSMDTNDVFQPQMTVEDVLRKWPETWTVFMSKKTDCVGCFMQRFCTIQDVAETYQIPLEVLTGELESCVIQFKNTQRSTT